MLRSNLRVNGEEAYALDFANQPSELAGVQYRFQGIAAIKDKRFMQGTRVIDL